MGLPSSKGEPGERGDAIMTVGDILCASGIATSVALLIVYHVSVARELWEARRETSRFPLFAARTDLVLLVASGTMQEEDPAWANLYRQVNFLLRMDQKLDLWHFFTQYVNSLVEREKNAELRERIEEIKRLETDAARRIPEFARIRDDANRGLMHMVNLRTRARHRAAASAVIVFVYFVYVAVSAGVRTAQTIAGAIRNPSTDDFVGWQEMNRTFC